MAASDSSIPAPDAAHSNDWRRQHRRHRTNCLTCNLGEVVDLSRTGMRIDAQGRPAMKLGDVAKLTLHSPEGDLTVSGRAAWLRRKGLRSYEMGIEFLNVRRPIAQALESLGRFGFLGTDRLLQHDRTGKGSPPEDPSRQGPTAPERALPDNVENVSQLMESSLRRLGMKPRKRDRG